MKKRVLVIIILQLLFIIICGTIVKNVVQREFLLGNLKSIKIELISADNFYERTKEKTDEDNYHEIRQSWKHLVSSIGNVILLHIKLCLIKADCCSNQLRCLLLQF